MIVLSYSFQTNSQDSTLTKAFVKIQRFELRERACTGRAIA